MAQQSARSWFLVFNHPQEIVRYKVNSSGEYILDVNNDRIVESSEPNEYANLSPEELCDKMLDIWCSESETRTGACSYCISAKGLKHLHLVLEDAEPFRFSKVKKAFPRAHIEPTRGNKAQAENYINKLGKYAEKGEQVVCIRYRGEIKGHQGRRSDLEDLEQMLNDGLHPNDILLKSLKNERYEKMIKNHYLRKRVKETPFFREIKVYWHVGPSGSGKTYMSIPMFNEDENDFYFVTDYRPGFMDYYCGEKILFLDEFRGQIPYSTLLTMLHGYRGQVHSRYNNIYALWEEVHITSVFPPEKLYKKMVDSHDWDIDTVEQLKRRITGIYYHWLDNEEYKYYYVEMKDYVSFTKLVCDAVGDLGKGFAQITEAEEKYIQETLGW